MNRTRILLWLLLPVLALTGTVLGATPSQAAPTCSATFTRTGWTGGAMIDVKLTNLLAVRATGWRLVVTHPASVKVVTYWNADEVEAGFGAAGNLFASNAISVLPPPGGTSNMGMQLETLTHTGNPTLTGLACVMYPLPS